MKRIAALLLLVGCAGEPARSPARLGEPKGVVVERGGVPSRVVACDQGTAYVFESGDGVHWREASSASVAFALLEAAPGWAVSRDYDSQDAGATPFRLWREDGMKWREVATLRASGGEAGVGE
jgi:hypothetical protein